MLQVLTEYLFGLSGASLRRSSTPMLLAHLAAVVSSSSRGRRSIKAGQILRKLKVRTTFRELLAVSLSMKAFAESLKAQTVTWFTDNQNVVRILNSGSKTPALQELAMDIHRSSLLNAVNIDMQWIPRDLISVADDISKFIDYDDYMINDAVFDALDDLWGPHTCDRFACSYNAKIQWFNSRFYQPGSSGVNAAVNALSHHNIWLCPPVYLTCKVIKDMELYSAQETLIVPLWKSVHFWPIMCSDGFHWSTFVHGWVILPSFLIYSLEGKLSILFLVASLFCFFSPTS